MQRRQQTTKPAVFIVESLRFSDEDQQWHEGLILSEILNRVETESSYRYIRTTKELRAILKQFKVSKMRYLHISCHGDDDHIALTLDTLSFEEFGDIVRPYLQGRRLFISACSAVNEQLASCIMSKGGCWSLMGHQGDIDFDDAALMWASFYHLSFKENPNAMKRAQVRRILQRVQTAFGHHFRYFGLTTTRPYFADVSISRRQK